MGVFNTICRILRRYVAESGTTSQSIRQNFTKLEQQYLMAMADPGPDDPKTSEVMKALKEIMYKQNATNWEDVNRAEQLMTCVLPEATIDQEISSRLPQADKVLPQELAQAYRDEKPADVGGKRALLASLENDLQWAYCQRRMSRESMRGATLTGCAFFVTFFALFLSAVFNADLAMTILPHGGHVILYAILAGAMGASYSTLTTTKGYNVNMPLEKLRTMCSFWYILSRIILGLCASLVLFYFMQTGLFQSAVIPDLSSGRMQTIHKLMGTRPSVILADSHFAMVVVYCFLAGFSEKLIPDLLDKVQPRGSEIKTQPVAAAKPKVSGG